MIDKEYVDLEQKYNDLLDQYKKLDDRVNRMIEEKYNLCRECEELKSKVEQLTILGIDLNQSNEILRKSFFTADKNKDNWREKAEKYKQAFDKIKEVCLEDTYTFADGTQVRYDTLDDILDIIKELEVLNEK